MGDGFHIQKALAMSESANPIYDEIGKSYTITRQTDARIAAQIHGELEGATRILNIGAGAGSYEPKDADLIAVEPSAEMIAQRSPKAHEVVQASADDLPFDDEYFTHTMTVLSMHHWDNRAKAFEEIKRVTSKKFVAVTWFPECSGFWLLRDYFPDIYRIDRQIFPSRAELSAALGIIQTKPLMIPDDCQDGFLAAFWKRPEVYLDLTARNAMSTFSKVENVAPRIEMLREDIETGRWAVRNSKLLELPEADLGYRIITAEIS